MVNANKLNENLQNAIRQKLPKGINIANILMDILSIGKEAVYRRLRGEVSFSLHEAALIAKRLGISLDSVISTDVSENSIFELKPQRYYDLREIDYKMLYEFLGVLKFAAQEKNSELVFTSNLFPQYPSYRYFLLGKYSSFKWMYLNQNLGDIKPFHEIEFPEEFHEACKGIINETMNIKNSCYIWDRTIFDSIVKEIKYFNSIRLIRNEDVKLLKEELHELLNYMEHIATKGKFETGNKIQIYISNISSDTGYSYLETDNIHLSMISAFSLNYVVSLETETLKKMKERIHFMKRVSTLISESGEMQRIQFFKTQREIVNTL